jgi:hypothetical protein
VCFSLSFSPHAQTNSIRMSIKNWNSKYREWMIEREMRALWALLFYFFRNKYMLGVAKQLHTQMPILKNKILQFPPIHAFWSRFMCVIIYCCWAMYFYAFESELKRTSKRSRYVLMAKTSNTGSKVSNSPRRSTCLVFVFVYFCAIVNHNFQYLSLPAKNILLLFPST